MPSPDNKFARVHPLRIDISELTLKSPRAYDTGLHDSAHGKLLIVQGDFTKLQLSVYGYKHVKALPVTSGKSANPTLKRSTDSALDSVVEPPTKRRRLSTSIAPPKPPLAEIKNLIQNSRSSIPATFESERKSLLPIEEAATAAFVQKDEDEDNVIDFGDNDVWEEKLSELQSLLDGYSEEPFSKAKRDTCLQLSKSLQKELPSEHLQELERILINFTDNRAIPFYARYCFQSDFSKAREAAEDGQSGLKASFARKVKALEIVSSASTRVFLEQVVQIWKESHDDSRDVASGLRLATILANWLLEKSGFITFNQPAVGLNAVRAFTTKLHHLGDADLRDGILLLQKILTVLSKRKDHNDDDDMSKRSEDYMKTILFTKFLLLVSSSDVHVNSKDLYTLLEHADGRDPSDFHLSLVLSTLCSYFPSHLRCAPLLSTLFAVLENCESFIAHLPKLSESLATMLTHTLLLGEDAVNVLSIIAKSCAKTNLVDDLVQIWIRHVQQNVANDRTASLFGAANLRGIIRLLNAGLQHVDDFPRKFELQKLFNELTSADQDSIRPVLARFFDIQINDNRQAKSLSASDVFDAQYGYIRDAETDFVIKRYAGGEFRSRDLSNATTTNIRAPSMHVDAYMHRSVSNNSDK